MIGNSVSGSYRGNQSAFCTWPLAAVSLACLCLFVVLGCSRVADGHRKVTGLVMMADGNPLQGLKGSAVLRFDPADPEVREMRESVGYLEEDGTFHVMTYEGGDGVPLGDYKVVLTMEKLPENYKIVPDPYTHYETTPWTATVSEDGDNHFVLKISLDELGSEKKDG